MGDNAKTRTLEGWLIRYNKPSRPVILPSGRKVYEVILSDAFRESVDAINAGAATIECNLEHVDDAICRIGLTGKNVKVENRAEGVYATVTLIGDTVSDDVFARAQAGIVTGLSVEFEPSPSGAEPAYEVVSGDYLRKWSKLTLKGFAITAEPMYPDAQIVKATEGEVATFARSFSAADLANIQADIERHVTQSAEDSRKPYEYEAFLLGIR